MKSQKAKYKVKRKKVKPVFKKGSGLWMLVLGPAGHLLTQLRYGNWEDGKKQVKRNPCWCASCAREEASLELQAA